MRLLTILILAAVWAVLVYYTHQAIGYDNATGYPAIGEDILWVGTAVLPLILGAFVINSRAGLAKYLRWLCAAALGAEAAFLLGPSWLKILGVVPLIGAYLLLYPEMGGGIIAAAQRAPGTPPLSPEELMKMFWRKRSNRWFSGIAIAGVAALLVWGAWYRNPLPSDEHMIEHFNAHRAEFEQLVQGVRNYRGHGVPYARSSDEVKALAKRLGLYQIGWGGFWYPDPYSERTARLQGEFYGHTMEQRRHARTLEQLLEYWQTNMPELFEGVAPVNFYPQVDQLTGVIFFTTGNASQPENKFTLRYGGMQKGYRRYPQIPQVKDGRILIPGYDLNDKPVVQANDRVLDSLDDFPPNWKRGECVLKRMDDHWFIHMCRAA